MDSHKSLVYKSLSLFLIILAVLSVYCLFWGPGRDWGASLYPSHTMSVSASDFVYATPDIATLSFSVVSQGTDTKTLSAQNNQKVSDAIAMLKEKGIESKDIRTSQYNLAPVYSQQSKTGTEIFVPSIQAYRLTQQVQVTIRDFSLISDIMSQLPALGVNTVDGLSFSLEDPEAAIAQARTKAFAKAERNAKDTASEAGVKLVRIVNVNANQIGSPVYAEKYGLGGAGDLSTAPAPTIEPGTQKVQVSVSMTYEIR